MVDDGYSQGEDEENSRELSITALTLNCWGLLFFSKHRLQRIQSIADYLSEQKYDIVFLQELWVKSDFELIRQKTSSIYKFAHLFPTKSILGTSGLAILSKWSPTHVSFMPFTVNGSPFRPWHGDWFTGKGTAYVRVDLKDIRIHLFCTHMHAQYSESEAIGDQYSIHRICQSYQLGKFINMTKDLVSDTGKSSELFILAGDLNTSPEEFPFQLLGSVTGLHDICTSRCNGVSSDEDSTMMHQTDHITCGHSENSYTESFTCEQNKEDKNRHKVATNKGKQIDFVLYKMVNQRYCDRSQSSCSSPSSVDPNYSCFTEKLQCMTKDPKTGLSFSDHQPVAVRFRITKHSQPKGSENGDLGYYGSSSTMSVKRGSLEVTDSSGFLSFTGDSEKCSQLPGTLDGDTRLEEAAKLMKNYMNENESSKQKVNYSLVLLGLTLLLTLTIANIYHGFISSLLLILTCFLITLILGFIFLVIEIVYRFEQHGIKSILGEMNCCLSSAPTPTSSIPSSVNMLK